MGAGTVGGRGPGVGHRVAAEKKLPQLSGRWQIRSEGACPSVADGVSSQIERLQRRQRGQISADRGRSRLISPSAACSAGSEGRAAASAAAPPFPMALSKQLTLIRRGMLPERRAAARAAASAQPQPSRAYVCSYEPHLPHRDRPRFPEIRRAARVMSAPRPPPAARHTRCGRRRRKEALDLVARARGLLAGAEGGGEEPESGQTWATRRREPRRRSAGAEVAPRPGSRRTSPRRTSPLASLSLWRKEAWLRQVGASSGRACPP